MSFTLLLSDGIETGGLERASSASGSVAASTTVRAAANGQYSVRFTAAVNSYKLDVYEFQGTANANAKGLGFWFNGTFTANTIFLFLRDGSNNIKWRLTYDFISASDGGFIVSDSSGTTIITTGSLGLGNDEDHFVAIWYEEGTNSDIELVVDGVSVGSATAEDLGSGNSSQLHFYSGTSVNLYYDDIYFGEATAASDLLGGMDIFPTVGDGSATIGGDALDAGTFPNVQEIPKNDTNLASYNAPTGNTDEREAPDTIAVQTNLTGSVTDIDDDPDTPDANWLTASGSSTLRNTFPTPTGEPTTGAGLQEFRVLMRKDATGPVSGTDTETLPPTGLVSSLNYTGAALGDFDDDPDTTTDYGDWDGNGNTDVLLSFNTPTGDPTVGADKQEFVVGMRKGDSTGGNTPDYSIELWESGVLNTVLGTGSLADNTDRQVVAVTFNASLLITASGENVEIKVLQTAGGSGGPANRRGIEVGGAEWNVEYDTGGSETQPGFEIKLYENGSEVVAAGSATGNLTDAGGDTVVAFTWDASDLGTADGSLVECYVNQTSGADRFIEIGAVEWNCKFPVARPAESGWIEADSGSLAGPSDVSGLGEIVGLTTYIRTQYSGSGSVLTHSLYRGNDVDGVTELSLGNATASLADFFDITTSASIMPLVTEQTRVGFGHPVDVDVDIDCTEIIGMVVHIPAGGRVVTCTTEVIQVSEAAATVNRERGVNTTAEAIQVSENASIVNRHRGVNTPTEAIQVNENAATINRTREVAGAGESITLSEAQATINRTRQVTTPSEVIQLSENAATVVKGKNVVCFTEVLQVAEASATINRHRDVNTIGEVIHVDENAATINATRNVTTTPETIELSENAATVNRTRQVTTTPEVIQLTENNSTINRHRGVNTVTEVLTLIENAATVVKGKLVSCFTEALQVDENASTVNRTRQVDTSTEGIEIAENPAAVNASRNVTTTPEVIQLSENNSSINATRNVDTPTEVIELSEAAATVNATRLVTTTSEVVLVTENAASIQSGKVVNCFTEALQVDEQAATVNATREVTTPVEAITLSENPATVNRQRGVNTSVEVIELSENVSSINRTREVVTLVESILISEGTASIGGGLSVNCVTEVLELTEIAATINRARQVLGLSEAITLSESPANVNRALNIAGLSESIVLVENASTVNRGRSVITAVEIIELSENPATIKTDRNVVSVSESILLTENAATIKIDRVVNALVESILLTVNAGAIITLPPPFFVCKPVTVSTDLTSRTSIALNVCPVVVIKTDVTK